MALEGASVNTQSADRHAAGPQGRETTPSNGNSPTSSPTGWACSVGIWGWMCSSKALHDRPRTSRVLKSLSSPTAGVGAVAVTGVLTLPGLESTTYTTHVAEVALPDVPD